MYFITRIFSPCFPVILTLPEQLQRVNESVTKLSVKKSRRCNLIFTTLII